MKTFAKLFLALVISAALGCNTYALTKNQRAAVDGGASWSYQGSAVDLDFANNRAALNGAFAPLLSRISASGGTIGGSPASVQWRDGHISYAAAPRISDQGLLVEQSSTNLLVQSGLAGGSSGNPPTSWSSFGTGMAPQASAYIAGSSAYSFTSSASRNFIVQTLSVNASTTYTFSLKVERNPNSVTLQDILNIVSAPTGATVSFSAGATSVPAANSTVTATLTVAGTAGTAQFRLGAGCNGNVTGTVVVSMPQVEALAFNTSFIPTTSATATRSADVVQLQGDALTAAKNVITSPGTVRWFGTIMPGQTGQFPSYWGITDGTSTNVLLAYSSFGGPGQSYKNVVGNVAKFDALVTPSPLSGTTTLRTVFVQNGTSSPAAAANGGGTFSGSPFTTFTPTTAYLGNTNNGGGPYLNGYVSRFTIWPYALPPSLMTLYSSQ